MVQLPPGWTQEKLQNATVDDLRQLPEEILHELDQHAMHNTDAITVVVTAQLNHDRRIQREKLGLPPAPPKRGPFSLVDEDKPPSCDAFVEVVERNGWDNFSFLLYRIDHTDDKRWQQWNTKFLELVDQSMADSSGGERLIEKCLIPISDLPTVNLDSFSQVQRFYREVSKPSGGVTAGLDHGICLAADGDAIKSLLEPKDGVDPWVWVIDESHDFSQIDTIADDDDDDDDDDDSDSDGDHDDDEYPGHFPVAISSLIPDLFPMVAAGQSGEEVWACCSFDEAHPVWTSALEIP